jgi:WD40 repeat protein
MWNYNNGQLLKKMLKSNVEEVGDVIYLEMGSSKNIICVGWDRLVSMFQDNPEFPEAEPTRVYNGAGNSVHRGHEGDITTVDFAEPNWLVTGSVDGAIVVWNLEAGIIRFTLREPFLSLKRQEEKPVEKVLFYKDRKTKKLALLTCHADGVLRFWDLLNAKLLNEVLLYYLTS